MARRPRKPGGKSRLKWKGSTPSDPLPKDSSGVAYILPDGRVVAVDDAEAIFAFMVAKESDPEKLKGMLWGFAKECGESGRFEGAVAYLEKILTLEDDPDARARCLLTMGQLFEKKGDFEAAATAYSRAFTLQARENETWYFLNNNLAYSLNQVGRHAEAEAYCRAAIAIDPERHNAHKNLGLSLQGQGRYLEAAQCLLAAAQARPDDFRALGHLEDLLAKHEEIGRDHPELLEAAQKCREAVRISRRERIM